MSLVYSVGLLQCVLQCPVVAEGHNHTRGQRWLKREWTVLIWGKTGPQTEKLASEGKIAGEWTAANQLAVFGTSH